jgi:hypothetical protein
MRRSYGSTGIGCGFLLVWLMIISVFVMLVGCWTERSLDWMCSEIAGRPIDVPYWLACVATLVFNGVAVLFNVLIEIVRLFM